MLKRLNFEAAAQAAPDLAHSPMPYLRRAARAALLAALAGPPAAFGQPPGYPLTPPPVRVPQPPAKTSANSGVATPPAADPTTVSMTYPPTVYNSCGYPMYLGPVGGALSGYANVIGAVGQFEIQNQQARIIQTQADMSRIDYRRGLIDEQRYEQALQPTTLELRQQEQWRKLQSARNNPTKSEIWSGDALNALLTALQGAERQGLSAKSVPLDPDVLKQINLTTGQAAGAGMLKSVTNLDWPFALQDEPFKYSATKINGLTLKAVDEVKTTGRVSAATFNELDGAVAAMTEAVRTNKDLSSTDYIASKSFLDDLHVSVQSLRDPSVAKYLNGAYAAKGATVADLVQQMTSQGLQFAPATQDDRPSYTILYQALLAYDYRLAQLAAR